MKYLVLCSLIMYVVYNLYIVLKYGVPESLSQTSYILLDHNKGWIHFSVFCISVGNLILLPWIYISPKNLDFLALSAVGGFTFCGMTPLFHRRFQKYIHYLSAFITCINYLIWMWLYNIYVFIGDMILIFIMTVINKKNYVYHAENVIAISLMLFLLISIK